MKSYIIKIAITKEICVIPLWKVVIFCQSGRAVGEKVRGRMRTGLGSQVFYHPDIAGKVSGIAERVGKI